MSTTNREKRKQAKRKARERSKARTTTKAVTSSPAARFFGWDPEYHAAQDHETRRGLDQIYREALLDRDEAEYPDLYRKLAARLSKDSPTTYLRFGRIPPGGRSRIWGPGGGSHEKGASVFAGRFTGDGHYLLDLDNTLQRTLVLMAAEKKAYFVRGRRVGRGINGEPVLRDVDYTEPIPDDCLILTKTPSRELEEWNERAFGGRLEDVPELARYFGKAAAEELLEGTDERRAS